MATAQQSTVLASISMARIPFLSTLVVAFAAAAAAAAAAELAAVAPSTSNEEEKYRDGAEFNNNLVSDLSP
jgi:hypothetical protein